MVSSRPGTEAMPCFSSAAVETGGPLDRVVVGQGGITDTAGCQRGRQRLRRLLAVAEDRVGVEVDVHDRTPMLAPPSTDPVGPKAPFVTGT